MNPEDTKFIQKAIQASENCQSAPGKTSPKVGVVVVKDNEILEINFRGALEEGNQDNKDEHAEIIVLERKLKSEIVAGATLYTTFEPCSIKKHSGKSCAEYIIDRKIARVVIGMLDPNPATRRKGYELLKSKDINVEMFPNDLAAKVEDLNRDFRRYTDSKVLARETSDEFIEQYKNRDLNEWYKASNYIYADRNFYRDSVSIYAHLVEVIGGLSLLASGKKKSGANPERFMPKSLAWWFALCGKLGVTDVSKLLWNKFPGVCPYCLQEICNKAACKLEKKKHLGPRWEVLRTIGIRRKSPTSLGNWQKMFLNIYGLGQKPDFENSFARLCEELGELAEAIRVFPYAPGYFLSEAADVFAWLMNIQNNIDFAADRIPTDFGNLLEIEYCRAYPDYCTDCTEKRCICPPILENTIGRIAHEVSFEFELFDKSGTFMSPAEARKVFKPPL